mgnify:CR=1 FL=1
MDYGNINGLTFILCYTFSMRYPMRGAVRINTTSCSSSPTHRLLLSTIIGIFFFFLALINEIVWRNFSTDFWVAFKVWGVMPISMVFMVFQMRVVMQHSLDNDTDDAKA